MANLYHFIVTLERHTSAEVALGQHLCKFGAQDTLLGHC